jgi:hypothetical protein
MASTLIDVLVQLDDGTETTSVAKIIKENDLTYTIRYLSPTKKSWGDQKVLKYEKATYEIEKCTVAGFYDTSDEAELGLKEVEGGWVYDNGEDSDEYVPSSDPESETDVELDESEEEEED